MGVEVAFSGQPKGKSCMDEYNDISPEDDKKTDDVNDTNEEDDTFIQKCNDLRQYLVLYNKKYNHCFKGEAAAYFMINRELINAALTKCNEYDKRQEELNREKETQTAKSNALDANGMQVRDSAKVTLLGEKESELVEECKDETCKSKQLEDQEQPDRLGKHSDEGGQESEKITSGSLPELATPTNSLSTGHEPLENKAHSSSPHSQEDATVIGSPGPHPPKGVETVSNTDSSPQGTPIVNPDPKETSIAISTSENSDSFAIHSETSGKDTPGQSPQVSDLTSASPTLAAEVPLPGLPSSSGMSSSSDLSVSAATPLSVEKSPSDKLTSSSTYRLPDGVMLPASQYPLASQTALISQHLLQSQQSLTKEQLSPEKDVSSETESGTSTVLQQNCDHDKAICDSNRRTHQQDLHDNNLSNHHSSEPGSLGGNDFSEGSIDSGGSHLAMGAKNSSASHTESEGTSFKTYIIIILVILAVILLSLLLFKYACLRGYFSKKKKKKRQRIQEELDRIMYSPSIFDDNNIYLAYTRLEDSYWDKAHENYT
ncbi:PIR Superfamily Protein [Plasmodium ovale wallikeri]|uniref:PIR Superfamily Protein n=1 Tax=Plasmodium ovale wallikeri TaxID=864142 RepID=A0A1A8YI03_PLAOA|nr:PIR Superfamily Protein [Plasmodium ovale wallikeri]